MADKEIPIPERLAEQRKRLEDSRAKLMDGLARLKKLTGWKGNADVA